MAARRKPVEVALDSPSEIEGGLGTLPEAELEELPGLVVGELEPNEKLIPQVVIYTVAKGRSVTTRARGIVAAGQVVHAVDFAGGETRLAELVTAGYLTR